MDNDNLNPEEQEYEDVHSNKKPKLNSFFVKKDVANEENQNSNHVFAAIDNGDFYNNADDSVNEPQSQDFPDLNNTIISNDNVVYEEKANMTFKEKIQNFIDNLNKTVIMLAVGIILAIVIIASIVLISINKEKNSYKAEVIIPDIVYMGETSSITMNAKYTGSKKPKKDLKNTITTFEIKDKHILSVVDEELKGEDIIDSIIPIQEGRSTIVVTTKLDNRVISTSKQEVVVCPSFTAGALVSNHISVIKGLGHNLNIDFGEPECSRGVTYESSNDNIVQVDETGSISGIEVGQGIITIRKGNKTIPINVYVTSSHVPTTAFKVTPTTLQLSKGEKHRITIDYQPANATSFTTRYTSSNEEVATVSDGGLIKALKEGTTTIKVHPPTTDFEELITVVVNKSNSDGSFPTALNLDKTQLVLREGKSEKIIATITPQSVSNKTISWSSSNKDVATVDKNGVVYGKSQGKAEITATTNNGIEKTVTVTVEKMKVPTITPSDGLDGNSWHTKPYILKFSSPENGIVYYYGKSEDKMSQTESQITINKDEIATYYVKVCTRSCTDICTDKKDKKGRIEKDNNGNPIQVCTQKCSKKPSICSDSNIYSSKVDITKPKVVTIAGIENTPVKTDTVQIALSDGTSLVQKWCVTIKNSFSTCKWNTIQTKADPVINYTATKNGIYYVFAKDTAGNISDGLSFEITNIE